MVIDPDPEPDDSDTIYYDLDTLSYCIIFFGAGVGWFVLGYLLSDCCYYRNRTRQQPILAESVNQ